jgi:hypothetical protein
MQRVGEVLIGAKLLAPEQLERALRAQVAFGGRLGTNLVELGHVALDSLTRALGTQHDLPAALSNHFDQADRELQDRLAPELAERFACVPLMHVFGRRHGVVIASASPLTPDELAEVAEQLWVKPTEVIPSLAAELRIRYQLERVYGIPRPSRFLRLYAARTPQPPAHERRSYLDSIADIADPVSRFARGSREIEPLTVSEATRGVAEAAAFVDILERIRNAGDREQLGRLVLSAIGRFAPACEVAVILIVRGGVAIGWKSFSRAGEAIREVVVPLGREGLAAAAAAGTPVHAINAELAPIDRVLLRWLGKPDGDLSVLPITLDGQVRMLVACASASRPQAEAIEACTAAAGDALTRLVAYIVPPAVM